MSKNASTPRVSRIYSIRAREKGACEQSQRVLRDVLTCAQMDFNFNVLPRVLQNETKWKRADTARQDKRERERYISSLSKRALWLRARGVVSFIRGLRGRNNPHCAQRLDIEPQLTGGVALISKTVNWFVQFAPYYSFTSTATYMRVKRRHLGRGSLLATKSKSRTRSFLALGPSLRLSTTTEQSALNILYLYVRVRRFEFEIYVFCYIYEFIIFHCENCG